MSNDNFPTLCRNCKHRKIVREGSLKGMDAYKRYFCKANPVSRRPDLVSDAWHPTSKYRDCGDINHGGHCAKYAPKFRLLRILRSYLRFSKNKERTCQTG